MKYSIIQYAKLYLCKNLINISADAQCLGPNDMVADNRHTCNDFVFTMSFNLDSVCENNAIKTGHETAVKAAGGDKCTQCGCKTTEGKLEIN